MSIETEGRPLLIIEDDAQYAEILCAMMRLRRWKPRAVHTIADAFAVLRAGEHFDATILDLILPDSDVARSVDEIPDLKRLGAGRVIVLTGAPISEQLILFAKISGADGVLNKNEIRMEGSLRRFL